MQHVIFSEKNLEVSQDQNKERFDNIIKTLDEIQKRLNSLAKKLEEVDNKK